MHTPGPAAGTTPPPRRRPCRRWFTWPQMLHAAPVAVAALYGALWIAFHAGGGRASAHTLWQSLALTETLLALLLRHRKPVGALTGILAAYLIFDLDPLLLPAVLVALFTVAATRHRRTTIVAAAATAVAITAMPYLHGDPVSLPRYLLPRLAAAAIAAAAGAWLHARREIIETRPRGGGREPRPAPAKPGRPVPGDRQAVAGALGAVHPVPGVPARGPARHLHDGL